MITYDIVSNPSHSAARVMEFLPECVTGSFDNVNEELMFESADIALLERDSIRICKPDGSCELKYVRDVFEENFNIALKKVRFSL